MKHTLMLAVLFFTIGTSFGQDCNCEAILDSMASYLRRNYAGFSDKMKMIREDNYLHKLSRYRKKARTIQNPLHCYLLLDEWVTIFKDHHLYFEYVPDPKLEGLIGHEATVLTMRQLKSAKTNRNALDIEGIYHTADTGYQIAIIKDKKGFTDYKGVILSSRKPNWKPGDIKLELKSMPDNRYQLVHFNADRSVLIDRLDFSAENPMKYYGWTKVSDRANPNNGEDKTAPNTGAAAKAYAPFEQEQNQQVFFVSVNDSTSYLRIKSFDVRNASAVDSIVKAHEQDLATKPFFIIDIRGNGGGGDFTYRPLKKYLYTQPVHTIGVDFFATPENVKSFTTLIKEAGLPRDVEDEYVGIAIAAGKSGQRYYSFGDDSYDTLPQVLAYPSKIAVLIDKGCASAAEQFLLEARQSKKVTLCGVSTQGVLDYANLCIFKVEGIPGVLDYPTTRSRRIDQGQGIDNVGIKPDVHINFKESDWLEQVVRVFQ